MKLKQKAWKNKEFYEKWLNPTKEWKKVVEEDKKYCSNIGFDFEAVVKENNLKLENALHLIVIDEDVNEVIGYVGFQLFSECWYVFHMFVREDYRRKYIATSMYKELFRIFTGSSGDMYKNDDNYIGVRVFNDPWRIAWMQELGFKVGDTGIEVLEEYQTQEEIELIITRKDILSGEN